MTARPRFWKLPDLRNVDAERPDRRLYEVLPQTIALEFVSDPKRGRQNTFQERIKVDYRISFGDALLTIVILLGSLFDLFIGVARLADPVWVMTAISSFDVHEVTEPMQRLTRVSGWGALEGGALGLLLVIWRLVKRYRHLSWSGSQFQLSLGLTMVSKFGGFVTNASMTGGRPFAGDVPLDNIVLFVRLLLTSVCFVLSLYLYNDTLVWLWRGEKVAL